MNASVMQRLLVQLQQSHANELCKRVFSRRHFAQQMIAGGVTAATGLAAAVAWGQTGCQGAEGCTTKKHTCLGGEDFCKKDTCATSDSCKGANICTEVDTCAKDNTSWCHTGGDQCLKKNVCQGTDWCKNWDYCLTENTCSENKCTAADECMNVNVCTKENHCVLADQCFVINKCLKKDTCSFRNA